MCHVRKIGRPSCDTTADRGQRSRRIPNHSIAARLPARPDSFVSVDGRRFPFPAPSTLGSFPTVQCETIPSDPSFFRKVIRLSHRTVEMHEIDFLIELFLEVILLLPLWGTWKEPRFSYQLTMSSTFTWPLQVEPFCVLQHRWQVNLSGTETRANKIFSKK